MFIFYIFLVAPVVARVIYIEPFNVMSELTPLLQAILINN